MLCDLELCTGCSACMNICREEAIQLKQDSEGFLIPGIDRNRCTCCGRCLRVCPVLNPVKKNPQRDTVYACWSNDHSIRRNSSSGGVFSELGMYVLHKKGRVFGAAMDLNMQVNHRAVRDFSQMKKLRGSKYVQSRMDFCYRDVKKSLKENRLTLFTGTPCQTAGLYGYLGRDNENLVTCDLVCHGVPSPKVYNEYRGFLEDKFSSKIADVQFRDKRIGWLYFNMKICFKNGRVYRKGYFSDPYIRGFLADLFLRTCCYDCQYTAAERVSDITLGDFWGYQPKGRKDRDNDKGISLVMTNTDRGAGLFNNIRERVCYFERDLNEAINGNRCLSGSFPKPKKRDQFWKDFGRFSFEEMIPIYMGKPKISIRNRIQSSLPFPVAKPLLAILFLKGELKKWLKNKVKRLNKRLMG